MSESSAAQITALERRIVELEVRQAFQDQTIHDLDTVIRDFTARIEVLTRTVAHLERQGSLEEA